MRNKLEPNVGDLLRLTDGYAVCDEIVMGIECLNCVFFNLDCDMVVCSPHERKDGKNVYFLKVEGKAILK